MRGRRWTIADEQRLMKMKADRVPRAQIAVTFGVSAGAADMKFFKLRDEQNRREQQEEAKPKPAAKPDVTKPPKQAWQRSGERWSDQENDELEKRIDAGETFHNVGIRLNRTRWACKVQYNSLKRGTAAHPSIRTTREAKAKLAEEARQSQTFHQTLTAAILGDPLPGRSALDQRRLGTVPEAERVDYRTADLRPKPTLATGPLR